MADFFVLPDPDHPEFESKLRLQFVIVAAGELTDVDGFDRTAARRAATAFCQQLTTERLVAIRTEGTSHAELSELRNLARQLQ